MEIRCNELSDISETLRKTGVTQKQLLKAEQKNHRELLGMLKNKQTRHEFVSSSNLEQTESCPDKVANQLVLRLNFCLQ